MSYGIIYKQMSSEYIYSVYVGYPDYSYANYNYSESELWLKGGRGWLRNLNIGSPRLKMEPVRLVYLREEYEK